MTKPTSIFHQVQQVICDQLNSDDVLSAAWVKFIPENSKDIEYEVQNALGRQGIVGLCMVPKADYIGITDRGELAYELRDLTIQIVENVPVNRGLSASITALDAAQRAQEILASPNFTTFGVMNPVSIEQGEDSGLIVCQAKFNCSVRAKFVNPKTTKVKYTSASGLPDWEGDIVGELTDSSIPNKIYAEEVEIGSHVTSIGEGVFTECSNLTSVVIPDSVTSIGRYAFSECTSLTSVTIGNGVTSIERAAFIGCSNLTSVTIGNGVINIGDYAFSSCGSLTSVTIGNNVMTIGNSAFSSCSSLESVTIPDSVMYIGDSVFSGCLSLTSVTIGNSVTSIGEGAFYGCSGLESVLIPDSVTIIRDYAFQYCSALISITIGNSVASIGYSAFAGCHSLTSLTIPNSVTSIEDQAFENCTSLTSVTISDSVTAIGSSVFEGCSSLMSVTFSGKTMEQVQGMDNYSWDLPSGCILHCTDGDITI